MPEAGGVARAGTGDEGPTRGPTKGTAHSSVDHLLSTGAVPRPGLLQGTVADLDARTLGLELTAITETKSDDGPDYEELAEMSGVTQMFFVLAEMSGVVAKV